MATCPNMSTMCDGVENEYLADIDCIKDECELWMSPEECKSDRGMCAFKCFAMELTTLRTLMEEPPAKKPKESGCDYIACLDPNCDGNHDTPKEK